MKQWLQRIGAWLDALVWLAVFGRELRRYERRLGQEQEPEWSPEDAAATGLFYNTPTGRKMWALVRCKEAELNHQVVVMADPKNPDYVRGLAAGFRVGAAWILTFSQLRPAQAPESRATSDSAGAEEMRERMSP